MARRKKGKGKQKQKQKQKQKPRKRRVKISTLKKKADSIFSRYIRLKSRGKDGKIKCITCPTKGYVKDMQCGHFMSRRHLSTRYLERNCAPQCPYCNMFDQGRQFEFGQAIDKEHGKGTADKIKRLAYQTQKLTVDDYREIIDKYTEKVEKIENQKR